MHQVIIEKTRTTCARVLCNQIKRKHSKSDQTRRNAIQSEADTTRRDEKLADVTWTSQRQ